MCARLSAIDISETTKKLIELSGQLENYSGEKRRCADRLYRSYQNQYTRRKGTVRCRNDCSTSNDTGCTLDRFQRQCRRDRQESGAGEESRTSIVLFVCQVTQSPLALFASPDPKSYPGHCNKNHGFCRASTVLQDSFHQTYTEISVNTMNIGLTG